VLLSPARYLEEAVDYLASRSRECDDFCRLGSAARRFAETHMSFDAVANAVVRATQVTAEGSSHGS
jgi:hypothetical protein